MEAGGRKWMETRGNKYRKLDFSIESVEAPTTSI